MWWTAAVAGALQPWYAREVTYQVFVPSFLDTDGDGIGDLEGVRQKLSYIRNDVGAGVLQLSPIFQSPLLDAGYDVTDFRLVNPKLCAGHCEEELSLMLDEAKNLNLRVVLEIPVNHVSDQHPWFRAAVNETQGYPPSQPEEAFRPRFVWQPSTARIPPTNWVSVYDNRLDTEDFGGGRQGSAWTDAPDGDSEGPEGREYNCAYYHAYAPFEPDLNYRNDRVMWYMNETVRFWLQRVDGLHLLGTQFLAEDDSFVREIDPCNEQNPCEYPTTRYQQMVHDRTQHQPLTHVILAGWRAIADSFEEEKALTTSISLPFGATNLSEANKYFGNESLPEMHRVDNPLTATIASKDVHFVKAVLDTYLDQKRGAAPASWAAGSTETSRLRTRLGSAFRTKALLGLFQVLPGSTSLYYGDEILMEDAQVSRAQCRDPACLENPLVSFVHTGRDKQRSPMQWTSGWMAGFTVNASNFSWLPLSARHSIDNVAARKNNDDKFLQKVKEAAEFKTSGWGLGDVNTTETSLNVSVMSGSQVLLARLRLRDDAVAPGMTLADKQNLESTTIIVNFDEDEVRMPFESILDAAPKRLSSNYADFGTSWERRFSTIPGVSAKTIVRAQDEVNLHPGEVLVVSWTVYGKTGPMDAPHWGYFFMMACCNLVQYSTLGAFLWHICRSGCGQSHAETLPFDQQEEITCIVPCYMPNEQPIIMSTIEHAMNEILYENLPDDVQDPPPGKLTIVVVYNAPPEWSHPIEERLAALHNTRFGRFNRLFKAVRVPESKSKAENLNYVIPDVSSEFIAIYDADHHPDPVSLRRSLDKIKSTGVDCVQGSTYIREGPLLLGGIVNAEFFVTYFIIFPGMELLGHTGFFGGSNALWRTSFLQDIEFDHAVQTEDIDLSVRAILRSARISFCSESRSGELAPSSVQALWKQRLRWAMGWDQVTFNHMKAIRESDIGARLKCGLYYLLPFRWLSLLLAFFACIVSPVISTVFAIRTHFSYRYGYLGTPIAIANGLSFLFALSIITAAVAQLVRFEPRATRLRTGFFIVVFYLCTPIYILCQMVLVTESLFRIARKNDTQWVVTTRSGGEATEPPTHETSPQAKRQSFGAGNVMGNFVIPESPTRKRSTRSSGAQPGDFGGLELKAMGGDSVAPSRTPSGSDAPLLQSPTPEP
mmetsp:Transcript_91137/g.243993  ORF Transcript_91137/g.243993 Transcript_91137/m.243993 type:complete len:1164 (+) Transcript_91137:1-3492(+)